MIWARADVIILITEIKCNNKCNALESSSNHPHPRGLWKNGPWCQKGWGLLTEVSIKDKFIIFEKEIKDSK